MAYAHNGLLRTLNSIYNQSPYVRLEADIHDLLQFSIFWVDWIEEHHVGEEKVFFPAVERITGDPGVMSRNIRQHEEFNHGLHAFESYIKACFNVQNVETFNAEKFRKLIDSFALSLRKHLKDEIDTLLALGEYDLKSIKKEYVQFDLKMREGDKAILFPIVMGLSDASFEDEPLWPVVPSPVRWLIHYYFEKKYRSVWRFCPSNTWGVRRELAFGPGT